MSGTEGTDFEEAFGEGSWFNQVGLEEQFVVGVNVEPSAEDRVTMSAKAPAQFQARKIARGRLTSKNKTLLNLLGTEATANDMTAARKGFEQAYKNLEDAHGEFIAAKNEVEDGSADDGWTSGRL